jgi:hypothetical protein
MTGTERALDCCHDEDIEILSVVRFVKRHKEGAQNIPGISAKKCIGMEVVISTTVSHKAVASGGGEGCLPITGAHLAKGLR